MRSATFLVILVAVISSVGVCQAQSPRQGHFTLFGALSLPQGDFGDDSGPDAGLATTGFGAFAEYSYPLNSPGLSIVASAHVLFNGFDDDVVKDQFSGIFGCEGDPCQLWINLDTGSYLNVPLMFGLKYETRAATSPKFYLQGQVGMNIVRMPSIDGDVRACVYDEYEEGYVCASAAYEIEFDSATSFGIGLGGGLILSDRVNVGFRYYSLGEPEADSDTRVTVAGHTFYDASKVDQPVTMILLAVGVVL